MNIPALPKFLYLSKYENFGQIILFFSFDFSESLIRNYNQIMSNYRVNMLIIFHRPSTYQMLLNRSVVHVAYLLIEKVPPI